MIENIFAIEEELGRRLLENVDGLRSVYHVFDDEAYTKKGAQATHAAYIYFLGGDSQDDAEGGQAYIVNMRWAVITVIKDVNDVKRSNRSRLDGGRLLADIINAVAGWSPGPDHDPFIVDALPPPTKEEGFCIFPVFFRTETTLRGHSRPNLL